MLSAIRARRSCERNAVAKIQRRAWLALVLPAGLMLTCAACSEDGGTGMDQSTVNAGGSVAGGGSTAGAPDGQVMAGASPTGGGATLDGGAQGGGAVPGGTQGGAPAGGGATMGGANAGGATMGGGSLDAGALPDAGSPGGGSQSDASADADTMAGPPLKPQCTDGEQMGCSSFMSPSGMEVELGPYGAAMDVNVGKGFENSVSFLDNQTSCAAFAAQFGQSQESTDKLLDLMGADLKLYTVYRPANWVEGEKYPVVTWGNGTCAKPEGYGTLLRYVASHGFIVVAPNSRYVGSGDEQKRGIDFLFKANDDSASPYYQKVDTERVAAMGHSQGSQSTITAASDARIDTVILFNVGQSAPKPFFAISGDRDIAGPLSSYKSALASADKGAYMWMHMVPGDGDADGHLTLMLQPERLTGATVAWLKFMLLDDADSKTWFAGAMCKLCGHDDEFEFAAKGI